jgi:N-acetylglucosaminyldiphosphoundecaprenol N-acetyl-beta-D-mannosaminyltransferase
MSEKQKNIYILGNKIDCFADYRKMYDFILKESAAGRARGYVTVNNTHTMMEGFWNADYRRIINGSYLSIPDGKPLQVVGKLKGKKEISRLFGPSVMEKFIDWGRADNIKHFFLGSSQENLDKLKQEIERKYPGTKIAGMISPPYLPIEEWDNNVFLAEINYQKPDFIWVGLGAPKQERWMSENDNKVSNGLLFGIGAGFDYLAGNTRHAPDWMKRSSLEWLYRLVQEPRRLWKRYFTTIPPFIFFAGLELLGVRLRKSNQA